ncbi:family 43 glycosylhydrolase [Lacibacter luteus]|nr:family 43 glycosylhydrolase [Lacibacter luteus]
MRKQIHILLLALSVLSSVNSLAQKTDSVFHKAPAPLFRDPIYDGAADPVLVWNKIEKNWWMFYSARRANMPTQDVAAYYGTRIGVASSSNHGQTWLFRGYLDLEFEKGMNTFWAPDIIYHNNEYHMFVVYIKGVRNHWGGPSQIVHFTSKDLWDWKYDQPLKLSSDKVIDATIYKKPDGRFRIWYKDETRGSVTMMSESSDLKNWETAREPAIGGKAHEGPKVFRYKDYYWMLTDEWQGMRLYRSTDLEHWDKQGLLLDKPSKREDDTPSGAHGDVVVVGDKAYIFYFTHPGRKIHGETKPDPDGQWFHTNHRTSIQVAPLKFVNGTLEATRDEPFDFHLPDMD